MVLAGYRLAQQLQNVWSSKGYGEEDFEMGGETAEERADEAPHTITQEQGSFLQ